MNVTVHFPDGGPRPVPTSIEIKRVGLIDMTAAGDVTIVHETDDGTEVEHFGLGSYRRILVMSFEVLP